MQNGILNGLQLYTGKWFSDLVDENKLSNMLAIKPHEVASVVSYVFGAKDTGYSSFLDMLTGGLGKTMVINSREFTWKVMIDQDRAVTIRSASWNGVEITTANMDTVTPGLHNSPILLSLEDKWFGVGAILEFDDWNYTVRVAQEPYQDGDTWVYTCYITNGQSDSYIPGELMLPGKQVSRQGSAYEEYSEEADILNYNSHFEMKNCLQTMRLSYDITGSAFSTVAAIALKDPNTGKTSYMWADYQEWVALREWYKRMERMLIYGTYNANANGTVSLMGTNGRAVYTTAGLLQQISPANQRSYTVLTAEILEEFLFDLSYNVLGTNERKFVAFTGEMGLREFDRVLKEKADSMNLIDTVFITGSGQELKLGGQFKTYAMTNGIELTVKYAPCFDDLVHNRKLHPITGKPLESYKFVIVDFSTRDGQANVVKVARKDRELVMWNTSGSVAPGAGYGKSISTVRANAKDGYSVHFLGEVGIMLRDPRACGILYCDAEV